MNQKDTLGQEKQNHPVVLVHGLNDTTAVFKAMTTHLTDLGWSVHSLDLLPSNGISSLEQLAQQLADYVSSIFAPQQPFDLIGFSMGGIVTRYYLQRLGGIERVKRYISISAPNNGTLTAHLLPFPGIVQMRPESKLLQDLNRDAELILSKIDFTIMWTPFDLMIVPATSSRMSVAREVQLPVLLHPWMLKDSRSLTAITDALMEPLKSN